MEGVVRMIMARESGMRIQDGTPGSFGADFFKYEDTGNALIAQDLSLDFIRAISASCNYAQDLAQTLLGKEGPTLSEQDVLECHNKIATGQVPLDQIREHLSIFAGGLCSDSENAKRISHNQPLDSKPSLDEKCVEVFEEFQKAAYNRHMAVQEQVLSRFPKSEKIDWQAAGVGPPPNATDEHPKPTSPVASGTSGEKEQATPVATDVLEESLQNVPAPETSTMVSTDKSGDPDLASPVATDKSKQSQTTFETENQQDDPAMIGKRAVFSFNEEATPKSIDLLRQFVITEEDREDYITGCKAFFDPAGFPEDISQNEIEDLRIQGELYLSALKSFTIPPLTGAAEANDSQVATLLSPNAWSTSSNEPELDFTKEAFGGDERFPTLASDESIPEPQEGDEEEESIDEEEDEIKEPATKKKRGATTKNAPSKDKAKANKRGSIYKKQSTDQIRKRKEPPKLTKAEQKQAQHLAREKMAREERASKR